MYLKDWGEMDIQNEETEDIRSRIRVIALGILEM